MHIVDMPAYFFPHLGGIEQVSYANCKEWARLGHQVTIVTSQTRNAPREEWTNGIRVLRVPGFEMFSVPYCRSMVSLLEKLPKPDVIRVHYPHPYTLDMGVKFARKHGIPYVIHMHGKEIVTNGLKGMMIKRYNNKNLKDALEGASLIVSSTKKLFDQSKLLQPHAQKMRYVFAGVDVTRFTPTVTTKLRKELGIGEKKVLLHFGVLRDYKGLVYTVRALHYIIKKYPDTVLLIAGKGPQEDELIRLLAEVGVGHAVRFLGFIPEYKKVEYFALADIFILASADIREGFGLVALDAMAMETPTIVTNGAGVSELMELKKLGYVTSSRSDIAIADTVCEILKNPPSDATRQRWRKVLQDEFTWKDQSERYGELFESIVYHDGNIPILKKPEWVKEESTTPQEIPPANPKNPSETTPAPVPLESSPIPSPQEKLLAPKQVELSSTVKALQEQIDSLPVVDE